MGPETEPIVEPVTEPIVIESVENQDMERETLADILGSLEEIFECLQRLENSSRTENPVSQSMIADLATIRSEIAEQRGMLTALQTSLTAMSGTPRDRPRNDLENPEIENPEIENPETENPSEQSQVESTDELRPEEARRKHRIL